MIDNWVRARLPRYTSLLLRLYQKVGLTPNNVTVCGFLLALASAFALSQEAFGFSIALWWTGRIADGTDGIYARYLGKTSPFGAYLDIVLDMAAYSVMITAFAFVYPAMIWNWIIVLFLYILCITSALALGMGEKRLTHRPRDNRGLRLGAGLAEAGETGIAYTLFLVFPQFIEALSFLWICILSVTIVARTHLARRCLT